jgi:hypothetical protein
MMWAILSTTGGPLEQTRQAEHAVLEGVRAQFSPLKRLAVPQNTAACDTAPYRDRCRCLAGAHLESVG